MSMDYVSLTGYMAMELPCEVCQRPTTRLVRDLAAVPTGDEAVGMVEHSTHRLCDKHKRAPILYRMCDKGALDLVQVVDKDQSPFLGREPE